MGTTPNSLIQRPSNPTFDEILTEIDAAADAGKTLMASSLCASSISAVTGLFDVENRLASIGVEDRRLELTEVWTWLVCRMVQFRQTAR